MSAKAEKIAETVGVKFDGTFGEELVAFTVQEGPAKGASFCVEADNLSLGAVLRKTADTVAKWAK